MASEKNRTQMPPGSNDPDVTIPRAVREAAQRAEQLVKDSGAESGDPSHPTPTPEMPPPAVEPPPTVPPTGEPPQEPLEDTVEQISAKELHRLKTIAGRAESDRKRAREAIDQLNQRIEQIQRQQATQPKPTQGTKPLQLSQAEIDDYGEDFIGMVQRIAQHTVEGRIAPISQEVDRQARTVTVQQNQSMHQQMNTLYPDWQRMNEDERFIEWTRLPDPYSGAIRGELLQEAWNAGDARRVLAFFQGFISEEAALNPAGGGRPPAPAPAAPSNGAPAPAPPLSLTSLAAPGGARSASPAPAEKRMYTTADITRFYTEVAAGKWRGRDQERAAMDMDIHQAQHEGRIILPNRRFAPPTPPNGATR